MTPHRCEGCTRLFYPDPSPGAEPLRADALLVALSGADEERARRDGRARAERHRKLKLADRFSPGDFEERVDNDVEARGGEIAVARGLGLELREEFAGRDVGPYAVRWSRTQYLMIQAEQDGRFVFVTGRLPVYTLRGWYDADEAKTPERWDPTLRLPAYKIHLDELHDLRRLPEIRARQGS